MENLKEKIIYCVVLILFLFSGITFGYVKTKLSSNISIDNMSILEYAKDYVFNPQSGVAVTASTKTYDIDVVYDDHYLVCNESVLNTKTLYGTTMDKVKEEEKKYQEEKGLLYEIESETENKIVYSRSINSNCPNHFLVILEDKNINIYSIQGENKKTVYMTIENVNVDNYRRELREKIEKGTYINSRDELNKLIEDLES